MVVLPVQIVFAYLTYSVVFAETSKGYAQRIATELMNASAEYPAIVWMYYDGNIDKIIRKMMDYTFAALKERWNLIFLTAENISYFIPNEDLPEHWSQYTEQAQSDLIRLLLLYRYGGYYID